MIDFETFIVLNEDKPVRWTWMMYFSHIPSGFNNLVAWNLTGGELFAALKILLGRIEAGSMSSVSL